VSEVGDGVGAELALGSLDEEAVLVENIEDGTHVTKVIGPRGVVDEDVIKEDEDEPTEERPQDVVHESLERCRGVAQPKRHDQELVEVVVCAERGLGDVLDAHLDLMVAGAEIQFGEEASAVELIEEFIDHGNQVRVLDRDRVQGTIVDAEALGAISFPHEQHRRGERRGAPADDALHKHGSALMFQLVLVRGGVSIGVDCHWCRPWK
jgi:hypothetical protein